MKRFIEDILIKWKDEKGRKPLVLSGARQVGKSYVIEQNFAGYFEQLLSINFEKDNNIQSIPLYAFGSWLEKRRGL